MEAYLYNFHLDDTITTDEVSPEVNKMALNKIILAIENGPMANIKSEKLVRKERTHLKDMYNPVGFSANFILMIEFLDCKLVNYNFMEEFLNKIRGLSDELKQRNIIIPKEIIYGWVLNNLTPQYSIATNITQSLRNTEEIYDLRSYLQI